MSKKEQIDAVINMLEQLKTAKQFFRGDTAKTLQIRIWGITMSMQALRLIGSYDAHYAATVSAHDWQGNTHGVGFEMEQKGITDFSQIFDEVIQIEIEAWEKVRADL